MKRAVIPTVNKSGTELAELENQIRIQNQGYYEIYERLDQYVSEQDQIDILNANLQMVPETKNQVSCNMEITLSTRTNHHLPHRSWNRLNVLGSSSFD